MKTSMRSWNGQDANHPAAFTAMRCDLHVHSARSGAVDVPPFTRVADESYEEPLAVYEQARRRGMDLFTLTDHNTIEGAMELAHLPDTFVSEEVSCALPGGRELHLGVFDISERQHEAIARHRHDAEALFAYLAEQRLPACVNHPFSALTGRRETEDLQRALVSLPLVEARNGMMSQAVNAHAVRAARRARLPMVGGSDAHTLPSVARAFTVVPDAGTREEFLAGLRRGFTLPAGHSGSYARLTADVARIAAGAYRQNARLARGGGEAAWRFALMAGVAPLLPLLPLVTAAIFLHEQLFARRHERLLREATTRRRRPTAASGPFGPAAAPTLAR
jgi:predicted metal-dependent phosphoesterase TrpH